MNQRDSIDSIFKDQLLQQMDQPGADENWQRLEKDLLAAQKKKRRGGAWLLGLLLLLGGSAALIWALQGNEKQQGATLAKASQDKPTAALPNTFLPDKMGTLPTDATAKTNTLPTNATVPANTTHTITGNKTTFNRKARQTITLSSGETASNDVANVKRSVISKKGSQKITIQPVAPTTVLNDAGPEAGSTTGNPVAAAHTAEETATTKTDPKAEKKKPIPTEPVVEKVADKEPDPTAQQDKKDKKKRLSGLQLELAAGVDISNGLTDPGKYGMAMLRIPLNKKANLLLGAGYANNSMTEGYKQADKPNLLNREIDAKLQGLNMLQFPILYEQAIKENKLMLRAGITPVYVLDANIVNVPNGFSGNPTNFRTFTLNDINRLNVLFTAGLHFRFTPRLGLELKGNYGLTELVKNSYINQSGENNNFKSAQVGLLFMIGRKKR